MTNKDFDGFKIRGVEITSEEHLTIGYWNDVFSSCNSLKRTLTTNEAGISEEQVKKVVDALGARMKKAGKLCALFQAIAQKNKDEKGWIQEVSANGEVTATVTVNAMNAEEVLENLDKISVK